MACNPSLLWPLRSCFTADEPFVECKLSIAATQGKIILIFVFAFFRIYAIVDLFRLEMAIYGRHPSSGSSLRHWPPGTDSFNVRAVFLSAHNFPSQGEPPRRVTKGHTPP